VNITANDLVHAILRSACVKRSGARLGLTGSHGPDHGV